MPENLNAAAQTSEQTSQTGTDAATGQNGENVNDTSFSDGVPGTGDNSAAGAGATPPAEDKKPQGREQNAENARRRREAERQKELADTRNKAIIEALGGKNPYTGGEMKDAEDVREFLTMREIENGGGDPVGDYSKHQKDAANVFNTFSSCKDIYCKPVHTIPPSYTYFIITHKNIDFNKKVRQLAALLTLI